MKYLAFAFDDANHTIEIIVIKNARNIVEARLELKRLIAELCNPALRPGDMIYGINPTSIVDAICSVSLSDAEIRESILNKKKVVVS